MPSTLLLRSLDAKSITRSLKREELPRADFEVVGGPTTTQDRARLRSLVHAVLDQLPVNVDRYCFAQHQPRRERRAALRLKLHDLGDHSLELHRASRNARWSHLG